MRDEGAPGRAYLEGRGISEALWHHHGLGYVVPGSNPEAPLSPAWEGMVTFPIRAAEHVINFQGRRITGPDKLNCEGLPRWPFNMNALLLDDSRAPVYLCEGPITALALEEMGNRPAVALLGPDVEKDYWPLFSRQRRLVVLALDAKKGETEEVLAERQSATVERFRRLGFWRYLQPDTSVNSRYENQPLSFDMDAADVWRASGFDREVDLMETVAPAFERSYAFLRVPPGPPDKETAQLLARAVAKYTQGLTLTLRYEDGPDLGYYLDFTRRDGKPLTIGPGLKGEGEELDVLGIYARRDPAISDDDVYVQGDLETNLALMAETKKARPRLHLAVADGLDPALLDGLMSRKKAALPTKARFPTLVQQHPGTRPKRRIEYRRELLGPQGRPYEVVAVNEKEVERERLALPGLETLSSFDMSLGRAIYALYEQKPGPIIKSTYRELARIMGTNPDSGKLTSDLVDGLARLAGWAWRFDGTDLEGEPRGFLLRLVADYRYEKGQVSIGIPPFTHELLTEGKKGRDWMLVDLEKYRGLSPAASTLWGLVSAWRAPREWKEDRLAALVSDNERVRERRDTLHQALDELMERGHLYKWERVQGSTTGDVIIRLVKTPAEARSRLRRKNERVLNVQITKAH